MVEIVNVNIDELSVISERISHGLHPNSLLSLLECMNPPFVVLDQNMAVTCLKVGRHYGHDPMNKQRWAQVSAEQVHLVEVGRVAV